MQKVDIFYFLFFSIICFELKLLNKRYPHTRVGFCDFFFFFFGKLQLKNGWSDARNILENCLEKAKER